MFDYYKDLMATYADLHMHSSFSDGMDPPQALLARAKSRGLSVVAITDHDTFCAYEAARPTAEKLGLELITGIEVSTYYKRASAHILGYFIDEASPAAQKLVESNNSGREERMMKMLDHLEKLGYRVQMDRLKAFTGEGILGRVSLARHMVQLGYFKNTEAAFSKVLGDGKPAYEPVNRLTPPEAIGLIAEAGGVSSLAHPGISMSEKDLETFAESGLDAVEAMTPYHHENNGTQKWIDAAARLGLAVTGGSDCHGSLIKKHDVGATGLDFEQTEQLRARAKARAYGQTAAGERIR